MKWFAGAVAAVVVAGLAAAPFRGGGGARAATHARALEQATARESDPEALLRMGEQLRRAGRTRSAFEAVARAYDARFRDPRFSAALAEALTDAGQVADAVPLIELELKLSPESGELRAALALARLRTGRFAEALVLARKAVELEGDSPRAWRAYALACAADKRADEAWPAFARALALAEDDSGLLTDYGDALARFGRPTEGEEVLRRAAAARPDDPRTVSLLAIHLGRRASTEGARREAIALLRRAVALAPRASEQRYQLGRLLVEAGRPAEAAPVLEECRRLDRSLGEALLPLGQAYQAVGQEARARETFAAYRKYTDFRREAAHLELRLRRAPRSADLLLRMARLQQENGQEAAARHYYERAVEVRRSSDQPSTAITTTKR